MFINSSADMLAMMSFLRDTPPATFGIHVANRPDINGSKLQAGIRYLFSQAATPAPMSEPAPVATPAAKVKAKARVKPGSVVGSTGSILAAVRRVMRACNPKSGVPVLGAVRITVRDGWATIQATDVERHIVDLVPWPVADCDGCVSAKLLSDALRAMPAADPLTLEQLPSTPPSMIAGRKIDAVPGPFRLGRATLATLDTADFPTQSLERGNYPTEFSMPASDLRDMLTRCEVAQSTEETRFYLNGVYMHAVTAGWDDSTPRLRAVSTDGHRLMLCDRPLPSGAATMAGIIPRATVADMLALLAKVDGDVWVRASDKRIQLDVGLTTLTSKVVDGTFPEYQRVIPREGNATTFNRVEMVAATKAGLAISGERSGPVKLTLAEGACSVSATSLEGGTTWQPVEILAGGTEPIEIGFQARYLIELVGVMTGDVTVEIGDAGGPVRILDTGDSDAFAVLMPMRV